MHNQDIYTACLQWTDRQDRHKLSPGVTRSLPLSSECPKSACSLEILNPECFQVWYCLGRGHSIGKPQLLPWNYLVLIATKCTYCQEKMVLKYSAITQLLGPKSFQPLHLKHKDGWTRQGWVWQIMIWMVLPWWLMCSFLFCELFSVSEPRTSRDRATLQRTWEPSMEAWSNGRSCFSSLHDLRVLHSAVYTMLSVWSYSKG